MGLGSELCEFCGNAVETILHVMRDCPLVMPLWLNIVHLSARSQFFSSALQQWIDFNLSKEVGWILDVDWQTFWAMACYYIWLWRNKEKHNENVTRPTAPARFVLQKLREYSGADKALKLNSETHRELTFISWKPPPAGWVKLNTDGLCKSDGVIGCGGIIRGSDGEWLGGFSKFIGKGSAYIVELWGVLEGLQLARRLNFKFVELHVDSVVVVQAINASSSSSTSGRALIEKIRRLIQLDWEVVVCHSYCEANQCADAMANYGCTMISGCEFFDKCPSVFNHLMTADIMGIQFPRLIPL